MELDEDVEVIFKESTGHRAVLVLRGNGLSDQVSDADPKHDGKRSKKGCRLSMKQKKPLKLQIYLTKSLQKSYELLKEPSG